MGHAVRLLHQQIDTNRAEITRLEKIRELIINDLTSKNDTIKELRGITESMESELKAEYDRIHSELDYRSKISSSVVSDASVRVSMNKVPGERTNTDQAKQ